jgi:hypothetical protein
MAVSVAIRGDRRRGVLAVLALAAIVQLALCAPAPGSEPGPPAGARVASGQPRALVAFLPARPALAETLLDELSERGLATGLTSATVGGYTPQQVPLDISQGARLSARAYHTPLDRLDLRIGGDGGRIERWGAVLDRADDAAGTVVPGLLASTVAAAGGTVAYAGAIADPEAEAVAAADTAGRLEHVSLGTSAALPVRVLELLRESELVITRLPPDRDGLAALDRILASAGPEVLVYVVQAPPETAALLPTGLRAEGVAGMLTSETTRTAGLVAATDVAPTVLGHLGLELPSEVEGQEIEGERGVSEDLSGLSDRLGVIVPRRDPALSWLLAAWAGLTCVLALARRGAGLRAGLRIGFLAALWVPGVALLTAALRPGETVELAILAAGGLGLGAATDRLVRWPAAPLVPAACVLVAHTIDLAAGSPLIATSLAGPNPLGGARFFGIGNELETILSVTLLLGTGAALALGSDRAGLRPPLAFAIASAVCALILGAGLLGAAVGAVITLGAGGAAAVLAALPARPGRRALALGIAAPVLLVGGLVAVDLATAGGAHLSREVLDGGGADELLDTLQRRLELSVSGLKDAGTAVAVGICAALLVAGVVRRKALLAPLESAGPVAARSFRAGLLGGLVATAAATLANDSGPVIFMIGSVMLILAAVYVQGRPGSPAARSTTISRCA